MNGRSGFAPLEDGPYVGIGEAAARLGLSRSSVQKLVDVGRLQAVKTEGGHRRILRDSLREQLDAMARRGGFEASVLEASDPPLPAAAARRGAFTVQLVNGGPAALARLRTVVQQALPQAHVEEAHDAVEAVLVLERLRPDVLVTDLQLQPFDGFRLAQLVKDRAEFRGVQVLVLTSSSGAEIARRTDLPAGVLVQPESVSSQWLAGWLQAHAQAREGEAR